MDRGKLDKLSGMFDSLMRSRSRLSTNANSSDEQIGQLYELMKAIQNSSDSDT